MVDLIGSKLSRIGAVLGEDPTNIISGSIQTQLHDRLLARPALILPTKVKESELKNGPLLAADGLTAEKRKRGRPKIYVGERAPTATERSKQSMKALADAGGKRIMLRLTPEAREALRLIMSMTGSLLETAAINQALVVRKNELLRTSTQN